MARTVPPPPSLPFGDILHDSKSEMAPSHSRSGANAGRDLQREQQPSGDETLLTANEMSLRDHLLAAQHDPPQPQPQHPQRIASPSPTSHQHQHNPPPPPSAHQQPHLTSPYTHTPSSGSGTRNLDPAITAQYSLGATPIARGPPPPGHSQAHQQSNNDGGSPGPDVVMGEDGLPLDNSPEGRKQRALSGSKRAAQNRAAQRAFRQRKESYIKKLEDDVRAASALPALQEEYHRSQADNYHLRDYISVLQTRLLEAVGEYPPPPPHVELRDPRQFGPASAQQQQQQRSAPAASMSSGTDAARETGIVADDAAAEQSRVARASDQDTDAKYMSAGGLAVAQSGGRNSQAEASAALRALRAEGPE